MPNTAPNLQQVIALTAAFNSSHELLLLKRPEKTHCGGLWSLPGGKVEDHEMPLQAAVRELKEETQLSGKLWRHLGKSLHHYDDRTLHFLLFVCYCPDISSIKPESEHVWVNRDKLDAYPMPEANQKLIHMLQCDEVDKYLTAL